EAGPDPRPRRHRVDARIRRRGRQSRAGRRHRGRELSALLCISNSSAGTRACYSPNRLCCMLDDISQAVVAREDVLKYLRGDYGESGAQAREKIYGYLDELRTTQRHKFYRALQHPLYPILRKIERKHENLHYVTNAVRSH